MACIYIRTDEWVTFARGEPRAFNFDPAGPITIRTVIGVIAGDVITNGVVDFRAGN